MDGPLGPHATQVSLKMWQDSLDYWPKGLPQALGQEGRENALLGNVLLEVQSQNGIVRGVDNR